MLFKVVPGGFLYVSNKLEQLEFKLEKKLEFRNMQEKLEKNGLDLALILTALHRKLSKVRTLQCESF